MSKPLVVVAMTQTKPESVEHVKANLMKLVEPTRAEAGCIQYDLHQDHEDPSLFVFFEQWESLEYLEKHLASAHIAAAKAGNEGHILSKQIIKGSKIA